MGDYLHPRMQPMPSIIKMERQNSYKIDEGYSEEPMRMESGSEDAASLDELPEAVMTLSEAERSGGLLS